MPTDIQVLPEKTINQIAAGEVIQRPASAVKELMENAIDAGSTEISLLVKDSGKSLIQVSDNGKGMTAEDAERCFLRHATSKIRAFDDLYKIKTMGFRGEALASVAAIAHVDLKTRRPDDELGTYIAVEGSTITKKEECQRAPGTTIAVRNLFFNVPARRSFLKTDAVELRHIIDEFIHIALAHPEVAFTFHHQENELYHLRPSNVRQRIVAIFGNHYNERLVPVHEDTDYIQVHGFIGKPENARRTRGEQFFFLNGRYIKNRYLNHSVVSAYGNLLQEKTYPFYLIELEIDPSEIDVNVHPTKQEVKFEDEKSVYMIVQAAVKHGLAQNSVTPSIDFEQEASFKDFEAFRTVFSGSVSEETTSSGSGGRQAPSPKGWKQLYEGVDKGDIVTIPSEWEQNQELPLVEAEQKTVFQPVQLHKTYILTQIKSGFILVHQNLAHQRILYERYMDNFKTKRSCQRLLFPVTVTLNSAEAAVIRAIMDEINLLGFAINENEDDKFTVEGVPPDLVNENPQHLLENMLELYQWNASHEQIPQRENIARALSRFAAMPAGRVLGEETMLALLDQLFGCREPEQTAYGHPTFIQYSLDTLAGQFGMK